MIAVQIGIIVFLLIVLVMLYQDESRKRKLSRKSARLNRFWAPAHSATGTEKERRKSVRINTEIDVLYESISNTKAPKQFSKSRNISVGGINLALNEKLFLGTRLQMQLNIPQSLRPVFVQGEIVWVKEISLRFTKEKRERFFATGIKFTQMKPEDEDALRSFINQRVKDAPEQITPFT